MPLREVLLSHLALTIGQRLGPDGWITPSHHPLPPVDEEVAETHARRLAAVIDLQLPDVKTVIVERRLPKPDPIALRRRALETMLGSQLAFLRGHGRARDDRQGRRQRPLQ